MGRTSSRNSAQGEIATPKARTRKPLDQRIAATRAALDKLEAEKLAQVASPALAKALRSFEDVAPFLSEYLVARVRHDLQSKLAPETV